MTPFPEAEIMTIKRLEVALRKMDYKLLKDGAYKLHEKYHSGHKFEYFDLLKEIFMEISNNTSVPDDVKDILMPTIEDILSQEGITTDTTTSPYESLSQQKVSSLTSLSYNTQNEAHTRQQEATETKINAFDAFGAQKQQNTPTVHKFFSQSPFSAQPFKEFNHIEPNNITVQNEPTITHQEATSQIQNEVINEQPQEISLQETQISQEQQPIQEETQEIKQDKKQITIFYAQNNSTEKIKNIIKLKELISNSRDKNSSIDDILSLISEISTQANSSAVELKGIIEQINSKGNNANLITNSQSEYFIELLNSSNITYSLFDNLENNKINLIPMYGLSNLFVCEECKQTYLNKSNDIKPLILECPSCKHPMFPDFWAGVEEAKINMTYYNKALINLANSSVWLLIHPSYNNSIDLDLIKSALNVSSKVEEIYIIDKDINARETYRNIISEINPEIKINIQTNVLEDFLNAI